MSVSLDLSCLLHVDVQALTGASRTAATDNLREALRDQGQAVVGSEVTPDTRMSAVAEL